MGGPSNHISLLGYLLLSRNNCSIFFLATRVPPKKPMVKKLVEAKAEGSSMTIKVHLYFAHYFLLCIMALLTLRYFHSGRSKTPHTPQKVKTKAVGVPVVIESDEEDLSSVLDLTLRKRKKQPKVVEALN